MVLYFNKLPISFGRFTQTPIGNPATPKVAAPNTPELQKDSFKPSDYLSSLTSETKIKQMVNSNPEILEILSSHNIPYKLNMTDLNKVLNEHCKETQAITKSMIENLPHSIKAKIDKNAIEDASYLHDIGKVFIPPEILDKKGRLTKGETKIMQLHSILGYELLKKENLSPLTLNIIKAHHMSNTQCPEKANGKFYFADINVQILSLADKYSALREARPYKPPLTREEALSILYRNEIKSQKASPFVYNALVLATEPAKYSKIKSKI